jgi:fumarate reductase subunit D
MGDLLASRVSAKSTALSAAHWAVRLQRGSGRALAIFLPLHFVLLAQALNGAGALDQALAWTRPAPLRLAEVALVTALALHACGGIRVLLLEFLDWHDSRKTLFAAACAVAIASGLFFAFNTFSQP